MRDLFLTVEEILPPLPNNLEDAQKEIRRLQLQLHNQNLKMEKIATKAALDRKAAAGTIKKLREELGQVKPDAPQPRMLAYTDGRPSALACPKVRVCYQPSGHDGECK